MSHSIEDGPARFLGDGPGAKARRRHRRRDESNVETPSEWTAGQQPAEHYRAAAARGRTLVAEATTPRVKEYLESLIHQCERLAGQVEKQIKPSFRRETGRMR